MRPLVTRRFWLLLIGGVLAGLAMPLLLWLTLPQPAPPPAEPPLVVRLARPTGEPIPADWEPPYLAYTDAVPEVVATLSLTATGDLTATLPLASGPLTFTAPALVAVEELNVRDGPGGAYVAVARVRAAAPLTIVARYSGWFEVVTPAGVQGWVDDAFVSTDVATSTIPLRLAVPPVNPPLEAVLATSIGAANVRSDPAPASTVLSILTAASGPVQLHTRIEGWLEVETGDGTRGWVAAELLETSDYVRRRVPMLTAAPEALEAVRLARSYIGYAYVWGAASPRAGFDCSGLVKYVYGRLGVTLPHGSIEQWQSGIGTRVARRSALRPGDIVYFKNTWRRGVSHVGIYAGDGLVIQAISERIGISVSRLDDAYWSDRYVGALRIFQ